MDIIRTKKSGKKQLAKIAITSAILAIVVVIGGRALNQSESFVIDNDSVLVEPVQRGHFALNVRGAGVLVPEDILWMATNVAGRVERIHFKAGAQVREGEVIIELSNPELARLLEETTWELQALESETQASKVLMEAEILDQKAAVINEKLNYERALLTLSAQDKLLVQGDMSVSQIAYDENKIDVTQFKQRWQLELERLEKKKQSVLARQTAAIARVKRMENMLARAQEQVDALIVTAAMDSILQEMPMELGQQVTVGTNLAKLARNDSYIAELRIPEKLIKDVVLGKGVVIDTKSSQIQGRVKRVDLAVINGSVQVDVALIGDLPSEVRPELTVNGIINIHDVENTLFVKRPMFLKHETTTEIYVVDSESNIATKKQIEFGYISSQFAQIKSGLQQGDSVVVSDTSQWHDYPQIQLN